MIIILFLLPVAVTYAFSEIMLEVTLQSFGVKPRFRVPRAAVSWARRLRQP